MTITVAPTKYRYLGNGVTTEFSYPNRVYAQTDLKVDILVRDTSALVETLTLTTDYSVAIATNGQATVTITNAAKIPSVTQDILLRRILPRSQSLELPTGTPFPAKNVENGLDKITSITQELDEVDGRTLKYSPQSPVTDTTVANPVADAALTFDGTTGKIKAGPTITDISNASSNAVAAATSALQAQTASDSTAFRWNFASSTTMADPSAGNLRLNNATLSSVTAIAVHDVTANTGAPNVGGWLTSFDDSTNTVKGLLLVRKAGTGDYALYSISSLTDNTTWVELTVTHISSQGSFAASDVLVVAFARAGDAGEVTLNGVQTLTNKTINGANNTITNIGTSALSDSAVTTAKMSSTALRDIGELQQNIQCPCRNLSIVVASDTSATVTADAVILYETTTGAPRHFATLSETPAITTSGVNGLDTGAEASNTWYHVWAIGTVGGVLDTLLSTSSTAPTMPGGYTFRGYLGAIRNNASSNFVRISQRGSTVKSAAIEVLNAGTATTLTSVSLSAAVPPTAVKAALDVYAYRTAGSARVATQISLDSADTYGYAIFSNCPAAAITGTGGAIQMQETVTLLTSQTIWYLVTGTSAAAFAYVLGWEYL